MKYINTPFNYTGSKFKLLEQILPKLDTDKKYFIDLFAGGGSVYTNILDKYDKVLVNDVIEDLIGIHKSLLESNDIINSTKLLSNTKEDQEAFLKLRDSYNSDKSPDKLWALMLGCTSNLMRFNQKGFFNQTWGKRQWNPSTDKKVEEFVNHIRQYKSKLYYTSKNFKMIIPKKPSMIYIDPPYGYIKDGDNMGNKQISEAGYNAFYTKQNDMDLYNYYKEMSDKGHSLMISGVLEHKGKVSWILDKLISDGFNLFDLDFDYNKVSRKDTGNITREVIITNYTIN